MDEALFIQTIMQLGEKYNVIVDVNYDTKQINFDGEMEDEKALAIELEEILGKYAE